jgi:hypothetical protein
LTLLRQHSVVLYGNRITLRPMTEHDWDILLKWNNDPDLYGTLRYPRSIY